MEKSCNICIHFNPCREDGRLHKYRNILIHCSADYKNPVSSKDISLELAMLCDDYKEPSITFIKNK